MASYDGKTVIYGWFYCSHVPDFPFYQAILTNLPSLEITIKNQGMKWIHSLTKLGITPCAKYDKIFIVFIFAPTPPESVLGRFHIL